MDLQNYIRRFDGIQKVEKIIDIVSMLVNILKYVHCSKRTYNNLKPANIMVNTNENMDADPEIFLIDFG